LIDHRALPPFDRITPEHVEPGMRVVLGELESWLGELERAGGDRWSDLVEPLERIHDQLARTWGVVGHLMGVRNTAELRTAHEAVQPEVVRHAVRLAQSRPVFEGLERLHGSPEFAALDAGQRRVVETLMRDARLSGVALEGAARERFGAIELELARLGTRFSNQLLDATRAFALELRDPAEVEGLPPTALELAAESAREHGAAAATPEHGPWRITLDLPSYVSFMEHAVRRDLRERLYRAYVTRASQGELDNTPVLREILALRREQALLLGYRSYAELSLASKMAPDVDAVKRLLEELREVSHPAARGEHEELEAFARERGGPARLAHWDLAYFAERLREERYAYSEEALRAYFPLPRVLEGLFALAERLFEVRISPADGEAPRWHPDVRFFRIRDREGRPIAAFYLDPYSRPEQKRGGAWMDECVGRSRLFGPRPGTPREPVAYLVCNQMPPVGGKPSLMSFSEVETLFHEFGHGLQHLLTTVDYGLASGIRNIEWDAVELPSQFMENWCYERDVVRSISSHVDSGEPLPDALFEKLRAARTYRAASAMLRQLHFAFTDLELHHGYTPGGAETPFDVQRAVAQRTTILPPLPEDRFLCSFSHIFAGGYAAGYYSYKWAEVLAADAFAAFQEAGLDDPRALRETGLRFRDTVLALGGSRAPMDVFRSFRGREPSTDALLRQAGLLPAP
jgi:oligopeptidase A